MKFQVNRDVFSEAVSFAVKLLPQRTTQPILSGVLLEAADGALVLSSFDYEVSSRTEIGAEVDEPGRALVSGRLLADIASRLPNAPVQFSTVDGKIAVQCGSAKFTLGSMPVEEYPTLPQVPERTGVLPADEFADAVSQVTVAASRDDVTPVITGVQLEVGDNTLSLVATDRYRVAVREIDWTRARPPRPGPRPSSQPAPSPRWARPLRTAGRSRSRSAVGDRPRADRLQRRQEDRDVASHQGQLPAREASLPRIGRELRGAQHRGARRVDASRFPRARARSGLALLVHDRRADARGRRRRTGAGERDDRGPPRRGRHRGVAQALVPPRRAGRGALEWVRISFTKTDNPNKPGPVLVTSQSSKDQPGSDNYRYLLQPNLLLR